MSIYDFAIEEGPAEAVHHARETYRQKLGDVARLTGVIIGLPYEASFHDAMEVIAEWGKIPRATTGQMTVMWNQLDALTGHEGLTAKEARRAIDEVVPVLHSLDTMVAKLEQRRAEAA